MRNKEIAGIFIKIGDALEFKGEMPFKIAAYRKAARTLRDLAEDIEVLWKDGRLTSIPGVGKGIAKKIDEYLKTGEMKKYREAMEDIPQGLLELLNIQGMGAKTLRLAHDTIGVGSRADLERVIEDGSFASLPGMGEKKVENIKKSLEIFTAGKKRISIGIALPIAEELVDWIKQAGVDRICPAGSLRRMKETVGDIDILCASKKGSEIIDHFTNFARVERVIAKGETKGSIMIRDGYQIDLRVVPEECFGAALQYFTGSKPHNIKLRTIARQKGLKISEYGIFRGDDKLAGSREEEIYSALGLAWIPPELREDRGEIELGRVPDLIDYNDVRGDLHIHSNYSDGKNSIKEIAEFAKDLGYEYIAITDHSRSAKYANGLDEKRLRKEMREIERVEEEVGIRIFKGTEMDILRDGSLDFDDDILRDLDIVIAAVHMFPKQDLTEMILKACSNPHVDAIAHPTGRLISKREGYRADIDKVIECAASTNTALEINCYYDRLDLSDVNARKAKQAGAKIILSSDAHNLGMMKAMRLGIGVARRGWLSRSDVLNTLSRDQFEGWLKRQG
ncbi:MAG: DNA polymerase/3'-5' exonuclease PolX [Thermodesulfobacteriota bacterium]|nr:DNA polymerase/3'-5' exonuclease PolX [Thermodesulfobacteriota bacterium]